MATAKKNTVKKVNTDKKVVTSIVEKNTPPKKFVLSQRNKKLIFFTATALVLAGLLYLGKSLFVAAMVNNRPISRAKLISELEKQGGSQVLDSLVNESLIFQEAAKKNVVVSKDEVDAEVKKIEETIKSQGTDLDTALSLQGQTRADLNKAIELKLLIEKVLADKLNVTDKEVEDFYNTNKATSYKTKKLEEVKDEIKAGLKDQKIQTAYQAWLTEIRNNAKINYFVNFK